jgi:hypothetical protein
VRQFVPELRQDIEEAKLSRSPKWPFDFKIRSVQPTMRYSPVNPNFASFSAQPPEAITFRLNM